MLIILHGEDTYRSRERLRVLREAFRKKFDPSGLGTVRVDATAVDPERVRTLLTNQGFFTKRRLVLLERLLDASAATQNALQPLLEEASKGDDPVVVRWEARALGARTPFRARKPAARAKTTSRRTPSAKPAETIPEGAKVELFSLLAGPALNRWYLDAAKSRGFTLTLAAVTEMVRRLGPDLWSGSTNLDKLNAARVGTSVDIPLVESLVVGVVPPGAFALTDAVAERRTELALSLLSRELSSGTAPLALLAQLTRQFRILVMVTFSPETTPASLAKQLGLHPYVAQKAAASARRFTSTETLDRFQELLELERALKSGHPNPELALERFVVQTGTVSPTPSRKRPGAVSPVATSRARRGSSA